MEREAPPAGAGGGGPGGDEAPADAPFAVRGIYRPQESRNIARSVYGLVLAMSVLAVYGNDPAPSSAEAAVTLVVTSAVFWVAHVYAEDLARRIARNAPFTWAERREVFAHEWPIVQATALPLVPLVLGVAGVMRDVRAIDAALFVCLGELALLGFVAAQRSGATLVQRIVSASISLGMGLVIVLLKALLH